MRNGHPMAPRWVDNRSLKGLVGFRTRSAITLSDGGEMNTAESVRKIAVIGLGYVGLPAAAAFGRSGLSVTGFDTSARRISELSQGYDRTGEVPSADLSG